MSQDYDPRLDQEFDEEGFLIGKHEKYCTCEKCEGAKDDYIDRAIAERIGK